MLVAVRLRGTSSSVQACRVALELRHPWDLRRYRPHRSGHPDLGRRLRRADLDTPSAHGLEAADVCVQTTRSLGNLHAWSRVSPPVARVSCNSNAQRRRVVGIGAARIATIFQQNTSDPQYGVAVADICMFIEPALAIVCACGPLFKPLITKTRNAVSKMSERTSDSRKS